MTDDYRDRSYLSAIEAARYLRLSVKELHSLVKDGKVETKLSTSGQMRFALEELKRFDEERKRAQRKTVYGKSVYEGRAVADPLEINLNSTTQKVLFSDARTMGELPDDSVHLMVTSPPYFDTKMYSREPISGDLGNLHELDGWFDEISKVWAEVFRVLAPGRKAFINIMNLPIREKGTFRSLNLVGRTVEVCEKLGFIFKRDIVWHKTNGVRAHFGTYPYPGGILLNNMHEFILELQKPDKKGVSKYGHLSKEQKEASRIDRDFWLTLKNSDVWLMKPEKSGDKRLHVAPFPYELPYRIIKAYSYVGETVLDPFCGSGIALRAAADLGRNGIGYEIITDFRDIIKTVFKGAARTVSYAPQIKPDTKGKKEEKGAQKRLDRFS